MKTRIGITAVALAALLTLGLSGCMRFHHRTPQERADRLVCHIVAKLDLDAGQQLQLQRIEQEILAKGAELRAQRDGDFAEMIDLLKSDAIDPTRFQVDVAMHQARASQLVAFIGDKFREFHDLLTPEQRVKAAQLLEEWRASHRRH
jgi:Spy/CpxP family protein refolding chaperone